MATKKEWAIRIGALGTLGLLAGALIANFGLPLSENSPSQTPTQPSLDFSSANEIPTITPIPTQLILPTSTPLVMTIDQVEYALPTGVEPDYSISGCRAFYPEGVVYPKGWYSEYSTISCLGNGLFLTKNAGGDVHNIVTEDNRPTP